MPKPVISDPLERAKIVEKREGWPFELDLDDALEADAHFDTPGEQPDPEPDPEPPDPEPQGPEPQGPRAALTGDARKDRLNAEALESARRALPKARRIASELPNAPTRAVLTLRDGAHAARLGLRKGTDVVLAVAAYGMGRDGGGCGIAVVYAQSTDPDRLVPLVLFHGVVADKVGHLLVGRPNASLGLVPLSSWPARPSRASIRPVAEVVRIRIEVLKPGRSWVGIDSD